MFSLHFNGEAKVSQLDRSTLAFARQQQVLRLQKEQGGPYEALTMESRGRLLWARTVPLPSSRWRQRVTSRRQRKTAWFNKYLQVPVDDVMLVDVVNTLQNLMDTVAKKSSTRNISAGLDNLIKDNLCGPHSLNNRLEP